jgi:hypothetical protein
MHSEKTDEPFPLRNLVAFVIIASRSLQIRVSKDCPEFSVWDGDN